jgi:tRNA(Phe) wybutosine-synthesizing methylase Tyw3
VWISAQPLILALYTPFEELAELVVSASQRVGLKYSGYRRVKSGLYYVTILGTERIDIPLSYGGKKLCTLDSLDLVASVVNSYLMLAKRKLERFRRILSTLVDEARQLCTQRIGGEGCGDEATLFRAVAAVKSADLSEPSPC